MENKFFKNKQRGHQTLPLNKYVPHYVQWGITPIPANVGSKFAGQATQIVSQENNHMQTKPIFQPNKQAMSFKVPNVGNHDENMNWNSLENNLVSNQLIDNNHPMIDNNDVVNIPDSYAHAHEYVNDQQLDNSQFIESDFLDIEHDAYVLFYKRNPIFAGTSEEVQKEASDLLLKNHELTKNEEVNFDDLVIFKKIEIKVGLYLK